MKGWLRYEQEDILVLLNTVIVHEILAVAFVLLTLSEASIELRPDIQVYFS